MSSLRVAALSFDWYPFEVRALRQAEAAADAGYDVDFICLRRPDEKKFEVCNRVRVYRVPLTRGYHGSLPITLLQWCWFLLLAGWKLACLHLKRRYDVVHVHNMPDFLVFAALLPKLLGAKVILDVQDVSPELMAARLGRKKWQRGLVTRLAAWQEYISVAFAHHVVTTGPIFAERLMRRGVPPQKITNILNSADPKLFPLSRRCPLPYETSAVPEEDRPFIIMYHGTLAKRNGLDTAMRALALARQTVPQLRLHLQGSGSEMPALKQLAQDLGAQDYISFADSVSADKLVDFVVHGDVGIIPYGCDGFAELVLPTKAYEFAWMHRPMIASDTPAIRSMFRPESLMLCDPNQPECFAEAMIDLYRHPQKRASLMARAAEDYVPYRWEIMAEQYQRLLLTLCRKEAAIQEQERYPVVSNRA